MTNEKFQNQCVGILKRFLQVCALSPFYLLVFNFFSFQISIGKIYFIYPSQASHFFGSSVLHTHQHSSLSRYDFCSRKNVYEGNVWHSCIVLLNVLAWWWFL